MTLCCKGHKYKLHCTKRKLSKRPPLDQHQKGGLSWQTFILILMKWKLIIKRSCFLGISPDDFGIGLEKIQTNYPHTQTYTDFPITYGELGLRHFLLNIIAFNHWIFKHIKASFWSSSSVLDHRSLPPVFESRRGQTWRLFLFLLHFIIFGGRSAHLAYHMHKSGGKTAII